MLVYDSGMYLGHMLIKIHHLIIIIIIIIINIIIIVYCGREEKPAILTSRLILRMRRMYVAMQSTSFPEVGQRREPVLLVSVSRHSK